MLKRRPGYLWIIGLTLIAVPLSAEPLQDAITRLQSKEVIKRRVAAQEIINLRNPASADALMQALSDKDSYVRILAARGLGYLRWAPAKDKLAAVALDDKVPEVRQTAVLSLRFLNDPSVATTLEKAVKDVHEPVRLTAISGLGSLRQPSSVEALAEASRDKSPAVRRTAYNALGQIGDAKAYPALVAGLKDPEPAARANAAQALGAIQGRAAIGQLEELLKDPDELVRACAAQALAMMENRAGLQESHTAARSKNKWVRLVGIEALGYLKTPGVPALLESMTKDPDPGVRYTAQQALDRQKLLK